MDMSIRDKGYICVATQFSHVQNKGYMLSITQWQGGTSSTHVIDITDISRHSEARR